MELQGSSQNSSITLTEPEKGDDDPLAKEYALFKAELESTEDSKGENETTPQSAVIPDIAVSIHCLRIFY